MEKKEIRCEYDIFGVCYSPDGKCGRDIACGAKMDSGDNGMVMRPKITVMQPQVINVSGVPGENVALSSKIEFTPVTKESYDGKRQMLLDDEVGHMSPYTDVRYRLDKIRSSLGIPKSVLGDGVVFDTEQGVVLPEMDRVYPGEKAIISFGDFDYSREDGK